MKTLRDKRNYTQSTGRDIARMYQEVTYIKIHRLIATIALVYIMLSIPYIIINLIK